MDHEIAELYRGPLEDFVARREAMVKVRRGQDPGAATAIARLRKPTLTAWLVDQLASREPGLVADLLAAGADARDAQRAAAGGAADGEDLRVAMGRVRGAVEAAAEAVAGVARHPLSDEAERRIRSTLQAAATGGAGHRRALLRGTLDRDVEPAGFGVEELGEADEPDVEAATSALRRRLERGAVPRPGTGRPRSTPAAALERASARRAADLRHAASRARALATAKREHADRVAEAARVAAEEAVAAERLARAAETAAVEAGG